VDALGVGADFGQGRADTFVFVSGSKETQTRMLDAYGEVARS
jgi:hypothetical protein